MKAVSHISDTKWRAIEKMLPTSVDRENVRSMLERMARDKSTPKQRAPEQEEIARGCDNLIRLLLKTNPAAAQSELVAQLSRSSDSAKTWAVFYRQIKRPRLLRQFEILWLWQMIIGGDLGYTTPRRKRHTPIGLPENLWPQPYGNVIPFFQASAIVVLGKAPKPRQIKDIVIAYQHMLAALKAGKIAADAQVIKGSPR